MAQERTAVKQMGQPRAPRLVGRDQHDDRPERHLEADADQVDGSITRITIAATAQIRIEMRSRSIRIAANTMPFITKARSVGTAAPEISRTKKRGARRYRMVPNSSH